MANRTNLAKIHIAKKELGLDDDTYRDILHVQFKKRSSKDLSDLQCTRLLQHFESLGWKQTDGKKTKRKGFPGKPKNFDVPERNPQYRKIEACLASRKLPWSYAKAMAKNLCNREALELCDAQDLHKIIQAFAVDARRRQAKGEEGIQA